jgi:uncharacterized protein (DUF2235 family)
MKRIAIFCDGTWNTPEQRDGGVAAPTNVYRLSLATPPSDPGTRTVQTVYYRRGVGNDGFVDRWIGGGFGRGLDRVLGHAYEFLVANFEPGDELYFFGFSRGAYTARSLAGLVRNAGILRRDARSSVSAAIDLYRSRSSVEHPRGAVAMRFRAEHSHETDIHFLGVWDTVGALGIPGALGRATPSGRYAFHDVELSSHVRHAYHALAMDERRRSFRPTLWKLQNAPGQVVEQAWFAGVHADVGGGYAECGLADIACLWMAEKAMAAGLAIDLAMLSERLAPDPFAPQHDSLRGGFRLLRPYGRPVGAGLPDSREAVHPTVYARRDRTPPLDPPYAPANLRAFDDALGPLARRAVETAPAG